MTCKCNEKEDSKDCPEGQSFDVSQGKCATKEAIGDSKSTSTISEPTSSGSDVGSGEENEVTDCPTGSKFNTVSKLCEPINADKTANIGKTNTATAESSRLVSIEKSLKHLTEQQYKPTATVSNGKGSGKTYGEIAIQMKEKFSNGGSNFTFDISLDSLRSTNVTKVREHGQVIEAFRNTRALITEAVSISGTHGGTDIDSDVAIVPGGLSYKPVFQFAKVQYLDEGQITARFLKTSLPASGSQTAGSTATEATQTITSIDVTPSTITGVYLIADYDEIENSPFGLIQVLVEASAANYEDFVATNMLDTVSKEGTLTPGLWIRGDTGAEVSTSDVASVAMDALGIAFAREYLDNQGYLRGGIMPVCFMDAQQFRELITSADVVSLATRSAPDIWIKANLEVFMGVQIVVTNAVEHKSQSNSAINAIMCVPKHSYGIAVKRNVTVKMHDVPEDNQVRINTSWRTLSKVIDATSIVRISTTD